MNALFECGNRKYRLTSNPRLRNHLAYLLKRTTTNTNVSISFFDPFRPFTNCRTEPSLYQLEDMHISIMNLIPRALHKTFVTTPTVKSLNLSACHMTCPNAVIIDIDLIQYL